MPESRNLEQAVQLYVSGKISLGKAADLADTNLVELKEILADRGHTRVLKASGKDIKKADRIMKRLGLPARHSL